MTGIFSRLSILPNSLKYGLLGLSLISATFSITTLSSPTAAAASNACTDKVLRQTKAKSSCIYSMQRLLQRDGATSLDTDSYFGSKTTAAVKAFQADNDLRQDGVVGRDTWQALCTNDELLNPGNSKRAIQSLRLAQDAGCSTYWND